LVPVTSARDCSWTFDVGRWTFKEVAPGKKVRWFVRLPCESIELSGLTAHLDKLVYHHGGPSLPPDKPHAFVYFITIRNESDRPVRLLGRKWVVVNADGSRLVIEGDKIVGETPRLAPGEQFSYNSYHVTNCNAEVLGCFHGVDEHGQKIHVMLPSFNMTIPSE
jgi:ApaG protein